ncbi:MAG: hypothetical protein ACFCD0_23235 [Gemmataceae bacterium]
MVAYNNANRCPICTADLTDVLPPNSETPFTCPRPYCGVSLEVGDGQQLRVNTFQLVDQYSQCVLPFSFVDTALNDVLLRLERSPRWQEETFDGDDEDTVDRIDYFLPYIRQFLFPKARRLVGTYIERGMTNETNENNPVTPCSHWKFNLAQLGELEKGRLPFQFDCVDNRKTVSYSWSMYLEDARLIVFGYRVGFLVLRFRCAEPKATLFDQMNSLNYLRPISPLYRDFEMGVLTIDEAKVVMPQLLAYFLADFRSAFVPKHPSAISLPTSLPVQPTYDDRMMVHTFSCVNKETSLENNDQAEKLLNRATVVHFDPPTSPDHPEPGENPKKAWFRERRQGFSKEGTCLVVFDSDKYHEHFLGGYHATYYFDVFLLATLQRVTLLMLYGQLSKISSLTTGAKNRRTLRRILRDLLLFKNQCCFSQITNRERGLVLWRRWQDVFENRTLLKEVNDQAAELHTYLQGRSRERLDNLLRAGGFLAATIPIILGLGVFLPETQETQWGFTLRWLLLLGVILGCGVFVLFSMFRERE